RHHAASLALPQLERREAVIAKVRIFARESSRTPQYAGYSRAVQHYLNTIRDSRLKDDQVNLHYTVQSITPATLHIVKSKTAICVCVPWRRYSNSHRSTLPGLIGKPGAMRSSA